MNIDHDVPLPTLRGEIKRIYLRLQPGSSVLIPDDGSVDLIRRVRGYMYTVQRQQRKLNPSFKLIARNVDNGVRVWRIE